MLVRLPGASAERVAAAIAALATEHVAAVGVRLSAPDGLAIWRSLLSAGVRPAFVHLAEGGPPAQAVRDLAAARGHQLRWVSRAAHDLAALERAERDGADALVVSPVQATPSKPGATPLGWAGVRTLAASTPLPVWALGGLAPADLAAARAHGAAGLCAIAAAWHLGRGGGAHLDDRPKVADTPDGGSAAARPERR